MNLEITVNKPKSEYSPSVEELDEFGEERYKTLYEDIKRITLDLQLQNRYFDECSEQMYENTFNTLQYLEELLFKTLFKVINHSSSEEWSSLCNGFRKNQEMCTCELLYELYEIVDWCQEECGFCDSLTTESEMN